MEMLKLPATIFTTQRKFEDYTAEDMRYGDLSSSQLKEKFKLNAISEVADPYTLTRLTPFDSPRSRFANVYGSGRGEKLTIRECANLLFDEMRVLSWPFSFYSPYKQLINRMLTHMQNKNGISFRDSIFNLALANQITLNKSKESSLETIKSIINKNVDYERKGYPESKLGAFSDALKVTVLPKFTRFSDNINGLGITVHDIHAMRIKLINLEVNHNRWKANVQYQAQDHFGLDNNDIMKTKFNQFRFFRIWFVLQRYEKFGFRPFMTDMETTLVIEGGSR
ncbi:uncharacterized protein (TIGR03034 family) [Erwinia toletana]|uniref:Uncharacterized protein (TIGR03034 family) n=1 Tax=Winslowiella toletana TaxID=92490 RepID=A0ABS4PAD6_9GAMM|nr:DUF3289 family protein [Winslowiella toletana]MBP2169593.1 uncharacterized protein (TIGR03034 family) [Winslowiella toletana]